MQTVSEREPNLNYCMARYKLRKIICICMGLLLVCCDVSCECLFVALFVWRMCVDWLFLISSHSHIAKNVQHLVIVAILRRIAFNNNSHFHIENDIDRVTEQERYLEQDLNRYRETERMKKKSRNWA